MSYQFGSVEPDDPAHGYAADEAPRRRSLMALLLALLVMGGCAGGLWVAYRLGAAHRGENGEMPLLRAEPGPTRIKPADPGGMAVPDRDMLIFRDARPQSEHLLPPPEAPMPRPVAPPPPSAAVPQPAATAPAPPVPAPATPPPPSQPAAETPQPAAAQPGVRLQFGSYHNQKAAEQEWQRLKHANPELLGKVEASVERADLGDKGIVWRIESRPVADPIAALELCETLKSRNVGCVIAR